MIKNTQQKVSDNYAQNFTNIFGDKPPESCAFVQNAQGKLVPRETYVPDSVNAPMVMKPLKDFKSPIDGQVISSRSQLAQHNKKHGNTAAFLNLRQRAKYYERHERIIKRGP